MGEIIYNYYVKAGEIGGINARTRLSCITKISSVQAKTMKDTPELIKEFDKAINEIKKEFQRSVTEPLQKEVKSSAVGASDILRKHISIFSDLTSQRSLFLGDTESTFKRITESIAMGKDVSRASIWLYDEARTGITCADLFEKDKSEHSAGIFLSAVQFPRYFKAIENERTLSANNAITDPRTSEFAEPYLKPLGIYSLLDVPIWVNGKMVGVVCHEQMGAPRTWTTDDVEFAYLMSNIISMSMESSIKKAA